MKKVIILAVCLISIYAVDAQTPFTLGYPPSGQSQYTVEDPLTGNVGIGLGATSTGNYIAALGVGNMAISPAPPAVLLVGNQTAFSGKCSCTRQFYI